MPLGDQRLRSAVSPLLAQKRPRRRPAAVPHERAGVEADLVAGVEDAEAQVDVVAGGLVTHIEPADRGLLEKFVKRGGGGEFLCELHSIPTSQ
jgi:hypothetical protein